MRKYAMHYLSVVDTIACTAERYQRTNKESTTIPEGVTCKKCLAAIKKLKLIEKVQK